MHLNTPLDHRAWCFAAGLVLAGRGVVSGRSAAYLWGADVLPLDAPVQVTADVGTRLATGPRLQAIRSPLPPGDVTRIAMRPGDVPIATVSGDVASVATVLGDAASVATVLGDAASVATVLGDGRPVATVPGDGTLIATVPVTTPLRTAFDLARRGALADRVVALDALLGRRLVDVDAVAALVAERIWWPGACQVARVLALTDPLAESPMESRLRLIIVDAGLPRPAVQYEVRDGRDRFVARLDLAYPGARLGVEYDGDHHRSRAAFRADVRRLNALHALGWRVLRFTAADVYRQPDRIVRIIATALSQDQRHW